MTFSLYLISIVIALVGFIIIRSLSTKYERRKLIKIHERIGYPQLSKSDQLKIITNHDYSSIKNLSEELHNTYVPEEILPKYITISKSDVKEHLLETGFLAKKTIENDDSMKQDGIWWNGKYVIDQERGKIHSKWNASTEDDALRVYTNVLWNITMKGNYHKA